MKTGMPLMIIGSIMFITGLMLFYLIVPEGNKNLEFIKNMGTFVGLSGMGVTLAGILLFLIARNEQPIKENYDI
jgi:cellobiose-specific phosphotransferase system component IIC